MAQRERRTEASGQVPPARLGPEANSVSPLPRSLDRRQISAGRRKGLPGTRSLAREALASLTLGAPVVE
jgi:hypothetical protein